MALQGQDGPQRVADLLREMQTVVLIFGIVLTVLGFFKGAYPKGSYSRFLFGITASVLVIVYVYSLLLNGRTQMSSPGRLRAGPQLHLRPLLLPALLAVLMQFGEFADHRRPGWRRRVSSCHCPRRSPGTTASTTTSACGTARFTTAEAGPEHSNRFRGHPLIVIILMKAGFSSLNVEEVDSMMSNLDDIAAYMVMLGVPLAFLAFFKGSTPRAPSPDSCLPWSWCCSPCTGYGCWAWKGGSSSIRSRNIDQAGLCQAAHADHGRHRSLDRLLRAGADPLPPGVEGRRIPQGPARGA